MKKYILFLSLGLGLLAAKEGFCTKDDVNPCANGPQGGRCVIRNVVPWTMYFYSSRDLKHPIAMRKSGDWNPVLPDHTDFPIYASENKPYDASEGIEISPAGCYTLNNAVGPYFTELWACGVGAEKPTKNSSAPKKPAKQPSVKDTK